MSVSELSVSAQNYLKVVWSLQVWSDAPVTATIVAERLNVTRQTVYRWLRDIAAREEKLPGIIIGFENVKKVIEAAGARMSDIVDLTSFHTDMRDLQVFMRVKDRYLTEAFPAWTAIGAAQLGGAAGYLIEIKAVAVLGG